MNHTLLLVTVIVSNLRATVCKYRESSDSCEKFNIFIFCPKDPLGKLFSKITLKDSADFYFWRNREKLKFPLEGVWRPSKWSKNGAFLITAHDRLKPRWKLKISQLIYLLSSYQHTQFKLYKRFI